MEVGEGSRGKGCLSGSRCHQSTASCPEQPTCRMGVEFCNIGREP